MSCGQVGNGWQLIACAQAASDDLLAQSGGDLPRMVHEARVARLLERA
jgi:hypothetical protein